jgi:hypothetical protein
VTACAVIARIHVRARRLGGTREVLRVRWLRRESGEET